MDVDAASFSAVYLAGERRPAGRPRTIPEQVADDLAIAIIQGRYRAGERILEQEISELYDVSRGPVREAIRALEKRGLLQFFPRRGAYVVGLSPDLFADLFNIRSALIGMAARQLAVAPASEVVAEVDARLLRVRTSAAVADPTEFAGDIGLVTRAIYMGCGNPSLGRLLHDQVDSLWGLIWHAQPLDFATRARREQSVRDWTAVANAICARKPPEAERLVRRAMARSRDAALAAFAAQRGEAVSKTKLFEDGKP